MTPRHSLLYCITTTKARYNYFTLRETDGFLQAFLVLKSKKYLLIQLQALLDGLNLIHCSSCAAVVAASALE